VVRTLCGSRMGKATQLGRFYFCAFSCPHFSLTRRLPWHKTGRLRTQRRGVNTGRPRDPSAAGARRQVLQAERHCLDRETREGTANGEQSGLVGDRGLLEASLASAYIVQGNTERAFLLFKRRYKTRSTQKGRSCRPISSCRFLPKHR